MLAIIVWGPVSNSTTHNIFLIMNAEPYSWAYASEFLFINACLSLPVSINSPYKLFCLTAADPYSSAYACESDACKHFYLPKLVYHSYKLFVLNNPEPYSRAYASESRYAFCFQPCLQLIFTSCFDQPMQIPTAAPTPVSSCMIEIVVMCCLPVLKAVIWPLLQSPTPVPTLVSPC